MGVYELLELDADMIDALRRGDPASFARAVQEKEFSPFGNQPWIWRLKVFTTLSEVIRISAALEDIPEISGLLRVNNL